MKKILLSALILVGYIFSTNNYSQSFGDYRSLTNGNWSSVSSWEIFTGSGWIGASVPPDGSGGTITIQNSHKITVDIPLSIGSVTIIVDGYLKDSAIITYPSLYSVIVNGTFELAHATASNQGLPTALWNTGSNCIIGRGITTATTGSNANQNFYNFIVDCPTWSGSLNFGWGGTSTPAPTTIDGDVIVKNTGTGRWQWCAPTAGTLGSPNSVSVTILGNLLLDGSGTDASNKVTVTSNGTSNNYTEININIHGNVTVTGNAANVEWTEFAISRGSQGGTGTTAWNLSGNFNMSDATTRNSNVAGAKFVFKKTGVQTLNFNNVYYFSSGVNFDVESGSTLQLNSILNIVGTLNLNGGIINSSLSNRLIMGGNYGTGPSFTSGTLLGGSSSSFVNGPMAHLNAITTSKTCFFPIGKNGKYKPIILVVTQDATTQTLYTAELFNSAPPLNTLPGGLDKISSVRYFTVSKGTGASISSASIQFNYEFDDGVTDYANLRIAKDDGSGNWVDLGGIGTANNSGSITSINNFTSLSNFVLANATGGNNLLQNPKVLNLTALIEGFYDGSSMISDTVTVELHNTSSPYGLVDQAKAVLNTSGVGTGNFYSAAEGTNYYIVIKHRNALETWSGSTPQFISGTMSYDFTSAQSQAYGSNMMQKGIKWCIFSGDVNQDGNVDLSDLIEVDNDNANFVTGYVPSDVNGDNSSDLSDMIIVDNNNAAFVGKVTP